MGTINEIFNPERDISDIIKDLKRKSVIVPSWEKLEKDYEPLKHKIVDDRTSRVDKIYEDGSKDVAARTTIGLEKLVTKRINEFTFAIPVKRVYTYDKDNEVQKEIAAAIEKIYNRARIDNENVKRGIAYYASCEFFTIWYTVKSPNTIYGFNSEYKLKCKTFSPMDGSNLYPLFDEYDDMIAMSYEYKKKVEDKEVTFFETYTNEKHYRWMKGGDSNEWREVITPEEISIKKIPVVYINRDAPVYGGLSVYREDLEYTLSRHSDVVAYNSAPVLKVSGAIKGEEKKGQTQRIVRVVDGGDVSYVSWSQSVEALKYHVDTLLKLFFMESQMPDLSFENMKSLGNIGYDARQTILSDAHLKIGDESGAWIEGFDRECNVIKAFLKEMNKSWESEIDNVSVEHKITPFVQNDESLEIDKRIRANGGKAIESQLESIERFGKSDNAQETLDQITTEKAREIATSMINIQESAE